MTDRKKYLDFLKLDDELTDEQKMIKDQIRRFVDHEVIPHMPEFIEKAIFPKDLISGIASLGLLEAVSTGDIDPITYGIAMRELERGGSEIRSFVSVQGGLVMYPISAMGSEEQKAKWLPALGSVDAIGCFGLTEPDYGSNPAGMQTTAVKTANGYKISGSKCWITNGTMADVSIIWARVEDGFKGFIVETDRKGFEAKSLKGKWSFRASDTAILFLDEVEVPESSLLPGATSLGRALKCLNQARFGILWGVIGAAQACLEEATEYLIERPQFNNQPLASHQLIQNKLAWMATELVGMQLLAKRLGEIKTRDGNCDPYMISMGKMNNCRKALEIARTCRELMGANGIHNEYRVGQHMTNLETVVTYEGTEHIHSLVIGSEMTGIKAYS